jgi:hypothetical protein
MYRHLSKITFIMLVVFALAGLAAQPASADYYSGTCDQPARLSIGGRGRVTSWPNQPNRVRDYPVFGATVLGYIPVGGVFDVTGGPYCNQGTIWWQVSYNGVSGWTGEGNGYDTYWLEPTSAPGPLPGCHLPSRLTVGGYGRVTPGLANVVRTAPGTQSTGANSVVIGEIPAGGVFQVHNGPTCGTDNRPWWYVTYNNLTGWTAEGEGTGTYWVEPYTPGPPPNACAGALAPRLSPGMTGRVTTWPYLPNRLRSGPSYGNSVIGHVPAGATFSVLSGPTCGGGTHWYQVSYRGVVGWTAEGGTSYYLEPAW